jgi:hypothetical protein
MIRKAFTGNLGLYIFSSSETSDETQWTTRHHIPENDTLHNHRCEHLKSYKRNTGLQYVKSLTVYKEETFIFEEY